VWFITNGIDAGVPQLIGSAFREETVNDENVFEILIFVLNKLGIETSG